MPWKDVDSHLRVRASTLSLLPVSVDLLRTMVFFVPGKPQLPSQQQASAAPSHPLGTDWFTITSAVVIPFVVTIFGVWLTKKWRSRLRVRLVQKLKEEEFRELSALYCDRVPDFERVPPHHFRAFFRRDFTVKSRKDLSRRISKGTTPAHLLLVARSAEGICGFIKAIYIPDVRCLFIAYLVASKNKDQEERTVTQCLLSSLYAMCKGSGMRSLVFEVSRRDKEEDKAKGRLFRHLFATHGLKLHRIDARYEMPEICAFDAGESKATEGDLYIAYLGNEGAGAEPSISRSQYKQLVAAIYSKVYMLSFEVAEPELAPRYKRFVGRIRRSLLAEVKQESIPLR